MRGLTVLECIARGITICSLVREDGKVVFLDRGGSWFGAMLAPGTVVDVHAPYKTTGPFRDAGRVFRLHYGEPGWVRGVGTTLCLVVHGRVGKVDPRGGLSAVELLVPTRMSRTSVYMETAAEELLVFGPLRSQLAKLATSTTDPRLRTQSPRAFKLRRGKGDNFAYYEIVSVAGPAAMPAGPCGPSKRS
jgi:hypothetical protein